MNIYYITLWKNRNIMFHRNITCSYNIILFYFILAILLSITFYIFFYLTKYFIFKMWLIFLNYLNNWTLSFLSIYEDLLVVGSSSSAIQNLSCLFIDKKLMINMTKLYLIIKLIQYKLLKIYLFYFHYKIVLIIQHINQPLW
jgi:hypothetical protein